MTRLWLTAVAMLVAGTLLGACGQQKQSGSATTAQAANGVDLMFVTGMIPHHESAIDMGRTGLRLAGHPEIRSLSRSIISSQSSEIEQMNGIKRRLRHVPADQHMGAMMGRGMMGREDLDRLRTARPFDRAFIEAMVPHHAMAVRMSEMELARGRDPEVRALARRIITAQEREITAMKGWARRWYGQAIGTVGPGHGHGAGAMHGPGDSD